MLRAGFRRVLSLAALERLPCGARGGGRGSPQRAEYTVTMGGTQIAVVTIIFADTGSRVHPAARCPHCRPRPVRRQRLRPAPPRRRLDPPRPHRPEIRPADPRQGDEFTSAVTYASGTVDTFKVAPPIINTIDRIPIERKDLSRATDMMAPFVLRGAGARQEPGHQADADLHRHRALQPVAQVHQGRYSDEQAHRLPGPAGAVLDAHTPISGHYTTSEITTYLETNERMLVWFAPLKQPGYFIPYRALVTTEAGDLSVVLTDLSE